MNINKNVKNVKTQSLFYKFAKEPEALHLIYDDKNHQYYYSNLPSNDAVFTLSSYLIGFLSSLKDISFTKAKNMIIKAIDKDRFIDNNFDRRSNLYYLLVNKFGLKIGAFRNFC